MNHAPGSVDRHSVSQRPRLGRRSDLSVRRAATADLPRLVGQVDEGRSTHAGLAKSVQQEF